MGKANWYKLTRSDLATFDDIATNVILYAMERGGSGRISRKGHAILRGPNGGTMSVPRDGNRSQQVLEGTVRKMFDSEPNESPTPVGGPTPEQRIAAIQDRIIPNPQLHCLEPSCEAVFVTEGARYSHIHERHNVCPFPGCSFTRDWKPAVVSHHRIVHEGFRPRKGTGGSRRKTGGKSRRGRPTLPTSNQSLILRFLKSRAGEEVTTQEIRQAIPGVDSTATASAYASKPGEWTKVTRVRTGVYRYGPPAVVDDQDEAKVETTAETSESTTVEPGNDEMLREIHEWITKERDSMSLRVADLSAEITELRRQLAAIRAAIHDV